MDEFEKKYAESLKEKQALENRKELIKVQMNRATELTSALDIEKVIFLMATSYVVCDATF